MFKVLSKAVYEIAGQLKNQDIRWVEIYYNGSLENKYSSALKIKIALLGKMKW